jgi:hypothetical protein
MTSENFVETKFYHLEGHFNFGTTVDSVTIPPLEELKETYGFPEETTALVADEGDTIELAGFAFIPDRVITSETADEKKFYTQGLKVVLVGIQNGGTSSNALSVYPPMESAAVITIPTTKSNEVNLESPFALFENIAKWSNFLFHYNTSVEFDLVFLDMETFEHFTTNNGFYDDQQKGQDGFLASRGIHFSRAAMDIVPNGKTTLQRFRTLNFAPHPPPDPLLDSMGREDIAYFIGQACPPLWHDTVAPEPEEEETTALAMTAVRSASASKKAAVQLPGPGNNHDTGDGRVSIQDLFTVLHKGGYIKEHQRVNIWPIILLRLIIWAVLIIGAVVLVSQLVKVVNKTAPVE